MIKAYKKIIIIASILLLLSLSIYKIFFYNQEIPQDIKVVEVTKVLKKTINQTIKLTGKIRPQISRYFWCNSSGWE